MPFCPHCKYEYKPIVTTCPDCGATLVDRLLEEDSTKSSDRGKEWVALARLTSQHLAEMLKGALEAAQIPVIVNSETGHFGQSGQLGVSSFIPVGGGYVVFVPNEFVFDAEQEARLILGEDWDKVKIADIK